MSKLTSAPTLNRQKSQAIIEDLIILIHDYDLHLSKSLSCQFIRSPYNHQKHSVQAVRSLQKHSLVLHQA